MMRDLVVTENITLDGVIDGSGGWFFPAERGEQTDYTDMLEVVARHREAADAFLVGRVTFEEMRGYWPALTDDTTGISDYLNRVSKFVVSSTLDDPKWANTTIMGDPLRTTSARSSHSLARTSSPPAALGWCTT